MAFVVPLTHVIMALKRGRSSMHPGDDWAFMETLEAQVREAVATCEVIDGRRRRTKSTHGSVFTDRP
jgi:hypothetical protein